MATWVIGDVHGCFETLRALLAFAGVDPDDSVILVGDVVNRGPRSLDVLRWARENEDRVTVVLGNHDLRLLATWAGVRKPKAADTFDEILAAPDCEGLLTWLRGRPLLVEVDGHVVVHAGLAAGWTLETARNAAREVEAALASPAFAATIKRALAIRRVDWAAVAGTPERVPAALSVFTVSRFHRDGVTDHEIHGHPHRAPDGALPWWSGREAAPFTTVFGHWRACGLVMRASLIGLDTGCVSGGALTAVRLGDRAVFQMKNIDRSD